MYWNTVTPLLREILEASMAAPEFSAFRLVGGTSLSLQLDHRMSMDIDLFTDAEYGTIDFGAIDTFFKNKYAYVQNNGNLPIGIGVSYYVGANENDAVKVDIYYTDEFIRPILEENNIRLASKEDIIAMKLEIMANSGRKKDFWDLHALHDECDIPTMVNIYLERYPYSYSEADIRTALTNFATADNDLDPICLQNKHWELIKLDFVQWLEAP